MIKNMLQEFADIMYKWHWFWFKHHMNWLVDDYKTDVWQAIDEAVKQVLESTARVGSIVAVKGEDGKLIRDLEPMRPEDFKRSYYNVFGNDRIDGQKVYKINKQ